MVIEVEKKTFGQKFKEQMTGFAKFMYNKETGEVMGRDGSSWAKIGLFYLVFYGFLAGFFATMLTVFRTTIKEPGEGGPKTTQFLKNQPGLHKLQAVYGYDNSKPAEYSGYTKKIDDYLKSYDNSDCYNSQLCPEGSSGYSGNKACKFDRELLKECSGKNDSTYGFRSAAPCVFVKINKVYGWVPANYGSAYLELICSEGTVYPKGYLISAFPFKGQACYQAPPVAVKVPLKGRRTVTCYLKGEGIKVSESDIAHRAFGKIKFTVG